MATVIVERVFDDPVSEQELLAAEQRGEDCAALNDVRRLQTLASADRRRFICIYEAVDADAVRRVQKTARVPYERIYTATVHVPD